MMIGAVMSVVVSSLNPSQPISPNTISIGNVFGTTETRPSLSDPKMPIMINEIIRKAMPKLRICDQLIASNTLAQAPTLPVTVILRLGYLFFSGAIIRSNSGCTTFISSTDFLEPIVFSETLILALA